MSTTGGPAVVAEAGGSAALEASTAPERDVARDMIRRSAMFGVPLLAGGALGWGWTGALSVGLALALVLVNFALGAAAIGWGARMGSSGMMAAAMGGYVVRLGIVTAAVLPVRHHDWFELLPFAVALLVTHLGLLMVEARRVSASLAFPGLKPSRSSRERSA
ncbi:MAG: ATP synthase subunit I [Acidimicrobiaceae bacterium]|nr:ATP synthase subunit I [Acidimicrobiaceae bacterium]